MAPAASPGSTATLPPGMLTAMVTGNGPPGDPDPPGVGEPDPRADPDAALPGAGDPELVAAGAAFRAELRADAAEWEQLAATDWLRRRSLADAARELLARGDRVAVRVAGRVAHGEVVHVGDDLACVDTPGGVVDVHLDGPAVWQVVQRVRAGGRAATPGARRFAARLAEHEAAGAPVCLVTSDGTEAVGVIAAVAGDHVVLDAADGSRWLLPRTGLAAVWPLT